MTSDEQKSECSRSGLALPMHLGRYVLEEEIDRGGMGVVVKGRDETFHRTLAFKVLLEPPRDRSELKRRFLEEAQLMAQLQHPGIAPVHDRGELPDGRPWLCMKLIKGRRLADLLKERGEGDLPRFVDHFEQVCQTVAYAHSRGIIHRDLKPGNIMVGAFGEVQVIDWGLAKIRKAGHAAEAAVQAEQTSTVFSTRAESGPGQSTEAGSVLGTPAYMAPEQARGEVERLDERADVFGLGAILCEILTGKPPFATGSKLEDHRLAMQGDVSEALERLKLCGGPPELVGLAEECLSPDRSRRPANADQVAQAIAAYQDQVQQRLRQAEIERARAETRSAEERKRRRVWLGLAVAILVLVVGTTGVVLWYQQDRAQLARQQEVEEAKQQAREKALKEASEQERLNRLQRETERSLAEVQKFMDRLHFADAGHELKQAMARFGPEDLPALKKKVKKWQKDWAVVKEMDDIRLDKAVRVEGKVSNLGAARQRYRSVLKEAGLGTIGEDDVEVVADLVRRSQFKDYLIGSLESWAGIAKKLDDRRWLLAVVRKADPHPVRNRFRNPGLWRKENLATLKETLAKARVEMFSPQLAIVLAWRLGLDTDEALLLLQKARDLYPRDFWINSDLGLAFRYHQKPQKAVGFFLVASALRPNTSSVHHNLGTAYSDMGDLERAIACYDKAIELDSERADTHYNLGIAYQAKKNPAKAIQHFKEATQRDPKDAKAHNNLGVAYQEQGDLDGAIGSFEEAIKLDPQDPFPHNNLGLAYRSLKDLKKAIGSFKKAIELDDKCAQAHYNLGDAYIAKGNLEEVIRCFKRAIELNFQRAISYDNLGNAYSLKGDLKKGIACYEKSIQLDPNRANAHYNLGAAYKAQGDLNKAIACYNKAIGLDPKHAAPCNNLGNIYMERGEVDRAIAWYYKAIVLDPKHAEAHKNLGIAFKKQGDLDEANDWFTKAIELNDKLTSAHIGLGVVCFVRGELEKAAGYYRGALRRDPELVSGYHNLGLVYKKKGDLEKAVLYFRKAIRFNRTFFQAHANLGMALQAQGNFEEAVSSLQQALKVLPNRHPARGRIKRMLIQCQQLQKRMERLPAVLRGEKIPATEKVQFAVMCQVYLKRYQDAARLYGEAFVEEPMLLRDLSRQHCYNAACALLLSSLGKGKEVKELTAEAQGKLRMQALRCLQTDLAAYTNLAKNSRAHKGIAQRLTRWQKDPDLESVRDPEQIKRLPRGEAAQWQQLWSDLEALLQEIRKTRP